MKKIILAIAALFTVGMVQAQDFSIGPKIGVSTTNIKVDSDQFESGDSKMGYHVGAFARVGIGSFFLQPEVLYVNSGGEIRERQGLNSRSYDVRFNKIDVPVMAGFRFAEVFRIQAGPVASILLNSDVSDEFQQLFNPDYNRTTLGYQAGIGLDLANLVVDLKYEGNLSKAGEELGGFATDQRVNQLILSVGFRIF
ncbi:porin family protein [Penaeicola halotolerans]|uniref:porin family protein n=1 Tax=Penaeicola halotolerans TaxID=2793196 RepID=UPI001CF87E65|nr:porin family protein [Penaeicola halotolerans]